MHFFFLSFFLSFPSSHTVEVVCQQLLAPVDDDYGDVKSFLEIENPFYAING